MSLHLVPVTPPDSELAWDECEARVVRAMSSMNVAAVALVEAVCELLARNGWQGWGISSPVHWLTWKANISRHRAEGIVRIAERRDDLPQCWTLFAEGRVTEDAMVRIAKRVPAAHDHEVARTVTERTISQLTRTLSCLPPLEEPRDEPEAPAKEPFWHHQVDADGWERGEYLLDPIQSATWRLGMSASRDAELRDRHDLANDADPGPEVREVTWLDAAQRMAREATDSLDAHLRRTGHAGERHQIVVHHHIDTEGELGPGRLHMGAYLERDAVRYLACDAQVLVVAWVDGKLVGIKAGERSPNRQLRRALEHRDGGCVHPLCMQKAWLHAHHLQHWEDGGLTIPSNLVMLCPRHHRELHTGLFSIRGNPEAGNLTFVDARRRPIRPPGFGADLLPPPATDQPAYTPPYGGRLSARDVVWN